MALPQALGSFDNRKKELVKTELDRIQEATNLANASMSSMNLPAALEVTKGNEIPQSLREKSQAVINAGKKLVHVLKPFHLVQRFSYMDVMTKVRYFLTNES